MMRWLTATTLALSLAGATCPLRAQDPPVKYALLVGLDIHRNQGVQVPELKYAVDDVRKLKEILEQQGYRVTVRLDEDAERDKIIAELSRHAYIVREQDSFLLYYAGHGVRNKANGQTYWLTYNANLAELDVCGIRLRHLLEFVREIPAKRKLVILDHCFSGDVLASTGGGSARDANPGTVQLERTLFPRDRVSRDLQEEGAGIAVLAASRGESYELGPPIGHGLFTSVLIQALTTRSADTQRDQKLSMMELATYVDQEIRRKSQDLRVPQEPLESLLGQDLSNWFLADLPVETNLQLEKLELYKNKLTAWRGQEWISKETALYCFNELANGRDAIQAGTELSPQTKRVLAAFDDALSTGLPEEKRRAEYLESTIQPLLPRTTP
jgi:caspase domain-containing protein